MIDLPAIPEKKVSFGHPDWISVNNAYGPACDLVAQRRGTIRAKNHRLEQVKCMILVRKHS